MKEIFKLFIYYKSDVLRSLKLNSFAAKDERCLLVKRKAQGRFTTIGKVCLACLNCFSVYLFIRSFYVNLFIQASFTLLRICWSPYLKTTNSACSHCSVFKQIRHQYDQTNTPSNTSTLLQANTVLLIPFPDKYFN